MPGKRSSVGARPPRQPVLPQEDDSEDDTTRAAITSPPMAKAMRKAKKRAPDGDGKQSDDDDDVAGTAVKRPGDAPKRARSDVPPSAPANDDGDGDDVDKSSDSDDSVTEAQVDEICKSLTSRPEAVSSSDTARVFNDASLAKRLLDPNVKAKAKAKQTFAPDNELSWTDLKKKKKALKEQRLMSRDDYAVTHNVKMLHEKSRQLHICSKDRARLIKAQHAMLRARYATLVRKHDVARIIQVMLKYASDAIRSEICAELEVMLPELVRSVYGHYVVKAMLTHGDQSVRDAFFTCVRGKTVKLLSHKISAPLVEYAYKHYADVPAALKTDLQREFYGPHAQPPFQSAAGMKLLADVYAGAPETKPAVLSAVKTNLLLLVNKASAMSASLVHDIMVQYLAECSAPDREEMLALLLPHFTALCTSKAGAECASILYWESRAKERKQMLRAAKAQLRELTCHSAGHLVVIAMLDASDDTVMLDKALLRPLLAAADELVDNEYFRRVLAWMVAPATRAVFHPELTARLAAGRNAAYSKKDETARRAEISALCVPDLVKRITDAPQKWFEHGRQARIAMLTLTSADARATAAPALQAIAELLIVAGPAGKIKAKGVPPPPLVVESPGIAMQLKKLLQHDAELSDDTAEEVVTMSAAIIERLHDNVLRDWIGRNRCCHVLVDLLAYNADKREHLCARLVQAMQPHRELLLAQTSTGAALLAQKLNWA